MNLSVTGSLALAHNRPTLNGDLADAPRHLDDASPKKKTRLIVSNEPGRNSGDVLLSHNLSSHYHRGCSVSLPCSEWERVGPLRYDHQRSEPDWHFGASHRERPTRVSGDDVDLKRGPSTSLGMTKFFQRTN